MAHNSTAASTTLAWLADLSDRELIEATVRTVRDEQRTTAELIALLAELDVRKLYLSEGYASLFTYCTRQLHLSEPAAYRRKVQTEIGACQQHKHDHDHFDIDAVIGANTRGPWRKTTGRHGGKGVECRIVHGHAAKP